MALVWNTIFSGLFILCLNKALAVISPPVAAVPLQPTPFDFSIFPECVNSSGASPLPASVPKLAEEFSVKLEVKMGRNSFIDSEGYYEKDGQRGSSYVLVGGQRSAYLFDFNSGSAFSVQNGEENQARTCKKEDLWETGCNTYAYFIAELAAHSNVSINCNLTAGNITYMGEQNSTVRAINVQMWQQCLHDYRRNVTSLSKYYFTTNKTETPSGEKPMPIRFETQARSIEVYDFTWYIPEVKDKAVFLPEPGVYCPGWARENETMPTLPDQFSMTMLTLAKKSKDVHSLKLNFDFEHELVAFITDSQNGTHFPPSKVKNRTLSRIVHDYNSGLSFSMTVGTWLLGGKDCLITPIDDVSLETSLTNSSVVHLRHARELFGLNRTSWTYVGERAFNGMPTYVWITQRNSSKQLITTETYWLHENWTTSNEAVLVGIIIYTSSVNGTMVETYQSIISDYNSYPFDWRTFDVDECLKNDNQQIITFCLKVQNYTEIALRMPMFETTLRDLLTNLSSASPLQFTDIQVIKGDVDTNQPHVWVTVLDWVNKTGNVANATKYQTADNVITSLKKNFGDKDLTLSVDIGGRIQPVTLMKNTIQNGADLVHPSTPLVPVVPTTTVPATAGPPAAVIQEGYTSGSMAGLAIAMILIGGVAGLVAGFLLWKRNTGIAYQVYD